MDKTTLSKVKVVDLFCGIGGLTHGLEQAGLNVVAGYDIDPSCSYAYNINNNANFFNKDIAEIKADDLLKHFEQANIKVLAGCAPCQPFSTYSFKSNKRDKWRLLYQFARLIEELSPEIVSMENVPRLAQFSKEPVFPDFIKVLTDLGYHIDYKVLNCAEYGIPQFRKRLVLLASKLGPITIIPPTHSEGNYVTVRDVIGNLPQIEHGETDSKDHLHRASKLTPLNLERVRQSKPGGTWRDWDENLQLACHKKASGSSYVSVYGRMRWDHPSPTITTQCTGLGNGRFGHPQQDRAISLREAAILQSFPRSYKFINNKEPITLRQLSTHIGNAVPVKLGEVIGMSIKQHLKCEDNESL